MLRRDRGWKIQRDGNNCSLERHFLEADSSLKSSLHVQYRMHEQIMDSINEFYEGKLSRDCLQNSKLGLKIMELQS